MTSLEGEKAVQGYITIYHEENTGGGIEKGNHPNKSGRGPVSGRSSLYHMYLGMYFGMYFGMYLPYQMSTCIDLRQVPG